MCAILPCKFHRGRHVHTEGTQKWGIEGGVLCLEAEWCGTKGLTKGEAGSTAPGDMHRPDQTELGGLRVHLGRPRETVEGPSFRGKALAPQGAW